MAKIEFKNVGHCYDVSAENKIYALNPFSLTWEDGGRYALLGPSGCGKTTMLNIMSGLITPSDGNVYFDENDITNVITEERNIAQVFQFPVIYNTMTVFDNLAFPLRCRKFDEDKIKTKVHEVAELLNLTEFLNKLTKKLTADQKQLISLGRGLVREDVAAVLMDEPLTVIDPDLKFKLRRKLKEINAKYKTTLIYVTHDQNEAMTFADNIIVMNEGNVVQIGTPKELFEKPKTTFVGYFIGSPAMNIYPCDAVSDDEVSIGGLKLKVNTKLPDSQKSNLKLGIRSEYINVVNKKSENTVEANINLVEDFGNYKLISATNDNIQIKVKVKRESVIPEDKILLEIPPEHCCIYNNEELVE